MGLFDWFRKKKVEIEVPSRRFLDIKCELCGGEIGIEKWRKVQGKYYHKKCYKKLKRQIMNGEVIS